MLISFYFFDSAEAKLSKLKSYFIDLVAAHLELMVSFTMGLLIVFIINVPLLVNCAGLSIERVEVQIPQIWSCD